MTAFRRLWARAPAWRGTLLLSIALSGLAALYPPQWWQPPPPGARYVPPPLAAPLPPPPPSSPAPGDLALPPFGAVMSGTVRFNGVAVPLPRGPWRVVAAMRGSTPQGQTAAAGVLAQAVGGVLQGAVVLSVISPPPGSGKGFAADPSCQSQFAVFSRVFSVVDHGPQACWTVEALTPGDWASPGTLPFVRAAVAELRQLGVAVPPVILRAYFSHADADRALTVQVIQPALIPPRPPYGWNVEDIRRDPGKVSRLTRLRDWAGPWNTLVRRGFEGALDPADIALAVDELP